MFLYSYASACVLLSCMTHRHPVTAHHSHQAHHNAVVHVFAGGAMRRRDAAHAAGRGFGDAGARMGAATARGLGAGRRLGLPACHHVLRPQVGPQPALIEIKSASSICWHWAQGGSWRSQRVITFSGLRWAAACCFLTSGWHHSFFMFSECGAVAGLQTMPALRCRRTHVAQAEVLHLASMNARPAGWRRPERALACQCDTLPLQQLPPVLPRSLKAVTTAVELLEDLACRRCALPSPWRPKMAVGY